ncbi:glycosyltransferase family 2 protein [Salinirubrum litoreum]|uniref:Glycosyltransferase family 2 protein n=1 Tax=Salinirubrum litoreum TaxID=1126234 RepID=A0ABD5RC60_9EURY|nr:glycosyltransferase family 2 protein [Salinirubrum litoreum]
MYKNNTIGVVVPAYNEEGFVGEVIDTIPGFVDVAYVVDDGSTDGTWEEICDHAAAVNEGHDSEATGFDRLVVPVQHEENRGVGGALKTGYLQALEDGVDITAVLGGDGQMDPDILTKYIDPIAEGDADYTKGNRFMRTDQLDAMPRFRLVGNAVLSYLTKVASGYWKTMDPQNGYTAISREALETADIENMYEYYGYCNDLLVKLNVENLRVADVSHSAEYVYDDEDWKSHISYDEYVPRVSLMLLRNFLWRLKQKYLLRDFHPLAAFYLVGTLLSGVAAVGTAVAGLSRSESGGTGRWVLGFVVGLAFFLAGTVLDLEDNEALELQITGDTYEDGR